MAVFHGARSVWATCRVRGLSLVMVAAIAACSPVYRNHGYVPAEDELAAVEVGVDTRETVGQKIGRPSTSGLLNDTGWFYVQSRYKLVGPREPQEVERQVLVVNFAENGTVSNIGRFGLEDGRVVELSRRVTETNIKGVSFIGQLLGGLGRLRAEDVVD